MQLTPHGHVWGHSYTLELAAAEKSSLVASSTSEPPKKAAAESAEEEEEEGADMAVKAHEQRDKTSQHNWASIKWSAHSVLQTVPSRRC